MVTLLPRQRMQRSGEVCHSVFCPLRLCFAPERRGYFDQHLILPGLPSPRCHHSTHLEPHHIPPHTVIVSSGRAAGAAGRAAQPGRPRTTSFCRGGRCRPGRCAGPDTARRAGCRWNSGWYQVHSTSCYRNGGKIPRLASTARAVSSSAGRLSAAQRRAAGLSCAVQWTSA